MPLSVPYLVLLAKQSEIADLKRLRARSSLVAAIGQLIHDLQAERGASSLFLASSGERFNETRPALAAQSETSERGVRALLEAELGHTGAAGGKLLSLAAWVLLGLEALPDLRERIRALGLSGGESVAAFSRMIAGLIALIVELADSATDPTISRLLVALLHLVEGKESAGQERAVGALTFGGGRLDAGQRQRIAHLIEAQEGSFRVFLEFADEGLRADWLALDGAPAAARVRELRGLLTRGGEGKPLDANLSEGWFDSCSERLTGIWAIQRRLVAALQRRCDERISAAERELFDSEGLLNELRQSPPARADAVDRFFDPALPVEQSFGFGPDGRMAPVEARSLIDLLQAQSRRLANMEGELESAKRALHERKLIERAKGVLMARFNLTEAEAHKQLHRTSMDQNRRLVEVAELVLSRIV